MEGRMAFQRNFLIFNAEDTGFEAGQKPSGHVRIEARDGKGKLWSTVQNLTHGDGKLSYKLYLIRTGGGNPAAVCAGSFRPRQGKAELEWEFDALNVHRSGYGIAEFDVAAVLAEYIDRKNLHVRSPLAAYKNKRTEWRKALEKLIYPAQLPKKEEEDFVSKYEGVAQSKYIPPETLPEYNIPDILGANQKPAGENEKPSAPQFSNQYQQQYGIHMPSEAAAKVDEQIAGQETSQVREQPSQQENPPQAVPASGDSDSNCVYVNGNMCDTYADTGAVNPCEACDIDAQARSAVMNEEIKGDINKLKELLDRNFEQSDPFQSKRSDYKWWKVPDPVNLNNILYQCNIRSPLLFNPMVMMAHFKYKHVIIGIYTDKMRKREYVVCGVPGMNMVDKKPFGDMCKWVQAEGSRPRYGGFGYWIVYIDPGTGKILSLK